VPKACKGSSPPGVVGGDVNLGNDSGTARPFHCRFCQRGQKTGFDHFAFIRPRTPTPCLPSDKARSTSLRTVRLSATPRCLSSVYLSAYKRNGPLIDRSSMLCNVENSPAGFSGSFSHAIHRIISARVLNSSASFCPQLCVQLHWRQRSFLRVFGFVELNEVTVANCGGDIASAIMFVVGAVEDKEHAD
jgi:hypothetical protein